MSKEETVRIAGVIRESIVDGPGLRFVVFTQGCPHACVGCHNPESHDPQGGYDCALTKIVEEIQKNPLITGVTFSGGEPFVQAKPLAKLARQLTDQGIHLMIYTGFLMEDLLQMGERKPEILDLIGEASILIDGKFILEQKNLNLLFRGSENQRVLDAKESLRQGKAVETTFDN